MLTPPRYVLSGGFWGSASCWFGKLDGPVRSSQPRDDVSAVLTGFGGRGGGEHLGYVMMCWWPVPIPLLSSQPGWEPEGGHLRKRELPSLAEA